MVRSYSSSRCSAVQLGLHANSCLDPIFCPTRPSTDAFSHCGPRRSALNKHVALQTESHVTGSAARKTAEFWRWYVAIVCRRPPSPVFPLAFSPVACPLFGYSFALPLLPNVLDASLPTGSESCTKSRWAASHTNWTTTASSDWRDSHCRRDVVGRTTTKAAPEK